ncbi:uncharacterized protein [Chelonus insularis]|uniref:uncharacterized protein n=1 Tax=Chelonus insularis TaxID=460826 RepID=UPI00158A25F4|nr:uncharacterized protein LOC118067731 [Chelonus insularis]
MANENTPSEMDRTEAAPLTSERRYGVFRAGLAAALILIVVLAGAGIALLFGIRDGRILLGILLLLMLLSATIAHLWFWWLHRKAAKRRERAANEWVSSTLSRQATLIGSNQGTSNNLSDLRYEKLSQKSSSRHEPPPGYHIVEQNN